MRKHDPHAPEDAPRLPSRPSLLLVALAATALCTAPAPALAWHEDTHRIINLDAAHLLSQDPMTAILYGEVIAHADTLGYGGWEEDALCSCSPNPLAVTGPFCPDDHEEIRQACHSNDVRKGDGSDDEACDNWIYPRSRHHFFQPYSEEGLSSSILGRPDGTHPSCDDAMSWARDDQGGGYTWTGALQNYGYTAGEKTAAYIRLGHVGHLLGDMSQPDHTHLEPHALDGKRDGLEAYAKALFNGVPSFENMSPVRLSSLEKYFRTLSLHTHQMSSFSASEMKSMFVSEPSLLGGHYTVYSKIWSGGSTERGDKIGQEDGTNGEENEVYPTFTEVSPSKTETPGFHDGSYYFVETKNENVRPAYYKGTKNGTNHLLNYFYITQLIPTGEEYIAGIFELFYDIVNHPPILKEIEVAQGTGCRYAKEWTGPSWRFSADPLSLRYVRTLEDRCTSPDRDGWINGHDGAVQMNLMFGSETNGAEKRMKEVSVRVGDASGGLDVPGSIVSSKGGSWSGTFTVPADGSLDGVRTVYVNGRDDGPHYDQRTNAGDVLDASPESPARVGSARPYNWDGYEPGADSLHSLKIDATPPAVTLIEASTDPQGRTVVVYQVSDATSGMGKVDVEETRNATVSVSAFTPGDSVATVTVSVLDRSQSAEAQVKAEDVAGNPTNMDVVLPVMAVKRGPEFPPINPKSNGMTPVAILADENFSPATLDLPTLRFGPGETGAKLPGHKYDVDRDTDRDLILQFPTDDAAIGPDDECVCLTGLTKDHGLVAACERIRTVGGGAAEPGGGGQISEGGGTATELAWTDDPPPASIEASLTPDDLVSLTMESALAGPAGPGAGGGFELEARILRGTDTDESNAEAIHALSLPADGAPIVWVDRTATPGVTYRYWLAVQGNDQETVRIGPVTARPGGAVVSSSDASGTPSFTRIVSAQPNPSRGEIRFRYGVATGGTVSMRVYNVRGGLVAQVVRAIAEPTGWYEAVWSGQNLNGRPAASGVYFARLELAGKPVGPATRVVLQR